MRMHALPRFLHVLSVYYEWDWNEIERWHDGAKGERLTLSCLDKLPLENECWIHDANRWKACRFGAGALFGDRPVPGSTAAGPQAAGGQTRGTESDLAPAPEWSSGPAVETAITAEETELLEIGAASYRRYLADGVRERAHWAVAVLQATGALVRFCSASVWCFGVRAASAPLGCSLEGSKALDRIRCPIPSVFATPCTCLMACINNTWFRNLNPSPSSILC